MPADKDIEHNQRDDWDENVEDGVEPDDVDVEVPIIHSKLARLQFQASMQTVILLGAVGVIHAWEKRRVVRYVEG